MSFGPIIASVTDVMPAAWNARIARLKPRRRSSCVLAGRDGLRQMRRLRVREVEDRHLEQDAVEPAVPVAPELAAGRRFGRFVDPAELERLGVDDAPVTRDVQHEDRMVAADLVEIPAREHAAFGHLRVVVAAAAQPAAGRRARELFAQLRGDLGQRRHGVDGEIEVQHVFGGDGEVRVRVVEPRHDHGVAEVDDLGVGKPLAQCGERPVLTTRSPATANASGASSVMVTMRRARKIVASCGWVRRFSEGCPRPGGAARWRLTSRKSPDGWRTMNSPPK